MVLTTSIKKNLLKQIIIKIKANLKMFSKKTFTSFLVFRRK
jgi:hypothetical protein